MNDRIAEIYDRLAPTWNTRTGALERGFVGTELRAELGRQLHGDVLEIGSGTGATLPHIDAARVASFTATDLSQGMLDQIPRDGYPVRRVLASADALPFADGTFDVVTCSLVLCTVPDPAAAIREMARVCKPGGTLLLLEHVRARNPLLAGLQRLLTPLQVRRMGCHFDRPTDRLVREMGFEPFLERRRFFGIFVLMGFRSSGGAATPA